MNIFLKMTKTIFTIFFTIFFLSVYSQSNTYSHQDKWVDSVYNSLSRAERIGQVFMIRAHSDKNRAYELKVKEQVIKYNVGGVCFFQGGPLRQISLVNEYQSCSKVPLFVAIDGEWGVGMRLDSTLNFPKQLTLGAVQDDSLIYMIGQSIGKQCIVTGININFAPVADVNNNPQNPVINIRSFGENPELVAKKSTLMMKGMQDEHVMACAKHFPGHGDTESDSHKTLPLISANSEVIDSVHLVPFKTLFNEGIGSVMNAHLFIPALDSTQNRASSLSPIIVDSLIVKTLHFKGLKFTDALEMKGVASYFKAGELELMALLAGNDVLLMPNEIEKAIQVIDTALANGKLDSLFFEDKVKRILAAKYTYNINNQIVNNRRVYESLNSKKDEALIKQAFKKASTLLVNDGIMPLTTNPKTKIAIVSVGADTTNTFVKTCNFYRENAVFYLSKKPDTIEIDTLIKKLEIFDIVAISIMGTGINAVSNYGISQSIVNFVSKLSQTKKVVLNISANPYSASRFMSDGRLSALMVSYEDNEFTRQISAENLFGGNDINGRLPVTVGNFFKAGYGLDLKKSRLNSILPEEIQIESALLSKIDSIAQSGVIFKAYPGCQVLLAKDGKIFYNKQFGYINYDSTSTVCPTTLYDIASVTKIASTTISLMKLESENKFDPDRKLTYYLPEFKTSNKKDLVIRDILAHQARLQPYLPFYRTTLKNNQINPSYYSKIKDDNHPLKVADSIFVISSIRDSVFEMLAKSDILARSTYKYSDLSMIIMMKVVEKQSNVTLDIFSDSVFYQPLGLSGTFFNPTQKIDKSKIAPTELDTYYRNQLIQGYVHDQTAALLGGVSGHAGLFSTSKDMAILMQMLLQQGSYGGEEFINPGVVEEYTHVQFPLNENRRGLGFDKPIPLHEKGGPCSEFASENSFGHSGFTGTLVWADPDNGLVYIFLSNRINPDADNKKLSSLDIRTNIHDEIYKILKSSK